VVIEFGIGKHGHQTVLCVERLQNNCLFSFLFGFQLWSAMIRLLLIINISVCAWASEWFFPGRANSGLFKGSQKYVCRGSQSSKISF